ncbi:ferredoxin [Streptomyces roseirectus]|uniref:Ferredoxin n=1 Tax=Streptomyces roseirectus TaxID=2768066 RepID=A0A7H0IJM3_9ACTN|nr:ferredoxin [Streptomyces roseirectus]QNP72989.1 ferredoxin [Streptomyces roseirectus]
MGDRWRLDVDRSLCIGSAQCVHRTQGFFQLDEGRQARPSEAETDASEIILEAAENCPVEAIYISLAESGEVVFPPED